MSPPDMVATSHSMSGRGILTWIVGWSVDRENFNPSVWHCQSVGSVHPDNAYAMAKYSSHVVIDKARTCSGVGVFRQTNEQVYEYRNRTRFLQYMFWTHEDLNQWGNWNRWYRTKHFARRTYATRSQPASFPPWSIRYVYIYSVIPSVRVIRKRNSGILSMVETNWSLQRHYSMLVCRWRSHRLTLFVS
jgi:hypothetical protein